MPDEQSLIADVLAARAPGVGDRSVWNALKGRYPGLTRNKVRTIWMNHPPAANLPAVIAPSGVPALSFYDTARQALAQAKTLAEVNEIADRGAAVREYARRAKDRDLMRDAEAVVVRAERRLGQMLDVIDLGPGQPQKNGSESEPFSAKPTLAELGIDKKLSSRAQKLASISEQAIEARLAARHDERGNHRLMTDILNGGPINGARSVMASRVDRDDHALDYYPTPPWATRALFEHVIPRIGFADLRFDGVWEPACGEGHMLKVIEEYIDRVDGSDIHDYGGMGTDSIIDFVESHDLDHIKYDWIITNPPFKDKLTERFVLRALDLAQVGVAMFVRSQWAVEGVWRYEHIFRDRPPTVEAFFTERVPLSVGRWDPDGGTATAYCWLVWVRDRAPLSLFRIPPGQREALSRPDDRAKFAAWSLPEK